MLLSRLRKGGFAINVLTVASGTAVSQLLSFLFLPLIARSYSKEEIGLFAIFSGITSIGAVFFSLRYESAISVAKTKTEGLRLIQLCLILGITFLVLTQFLFVVLSYSHIGGSTLLTSYMLFMLPLATLLVSSSQSFLLFAVRQQLYKISAAAKLCQSLFTGSIQLVLAALHVTGGGLGLAIGYTFGYAIYLTVLAIPVRKCFTFLAKPKVNRLKLVAVKFSAFPISNTPAAFLNALSGYLPIFIATTLYSESLSGQLFMVQKILAAPLLLVGGAIAQVYLGKAGVYARSGQYRELLSKFDRLSKRLLAVSLVVAVTIMVLGDLVFDTILGENWHGTGNYARLMIIGVAVQFIASPLSQTILVTGNVRWFLVFEGLRILSFLFVALNAKWFKLNALMFTLLIAISNAFFYAIFWGFCRFSLLRKLGHRK